jgi:hypothetical protein
MQSPAGSARETPKDFSFFIVDVIDVIECLNQAVYFKLSLPLYKMKSATVY